jgi:hypothetical protein
MLVTVQHDHPNSSRRVASFKIEPVGNRIIGSDPNDFIDKALSFVRASEVYHDIQRFPDCAVMPRTRSTITTKFSMP